MNNPKISIIVPVYNVKNYLKRCVETLTHQTLKEIEIILVDDGSKDNSGILSWIIQYIVPLYMFRYKATERSKFFHLCHAEQLQGLVTVLFDLSFQFFRRITPLFFPQHDQRCQADFLPVHR